MKDNEYLQSEDFYKKYNENLEKLKNDPSILLLDKLCYLTFESEEGKALMQEIEKRFLLPSLAQRGNNDFAMSCVYYEGFKDAFRLLRNSCISHKQRIDAQKDNNNG
jgi:hypothetical protein